MGGALTHTPAEIIQYLLIQLSQGVLPSAGGDWPIHQSSGPDTPDNSIVVTQTASRQHGRTHVDGRTQEHYGIQIAVRGATTKLGSDKLWAISVVLDESVLRTNVDIGSSQYTVYAVTRTSIIDAGEEQNTNRRLFTINVLVALRQTT